MKKNDIFEITITGIGLNGEGVGRINDFVVFVPYAALNETLLVKIVKVTKSYAFGKIEKIIKPSLCRQNPCCPVFTKCGGCQLQHITYEEELLYKQKKVEEAFLHFGKYSGKIEEIKGSKDFLRYRNKAQFPVGMCDNLPAVGFYKNRSHNLVKINDCALQDEVTAKVNDAVLCYMNEEKILPYCEETHSGLIRHIYTRVAKTTGEVMVVIVSTKKNLPDVERLISLLKERVLNLVSVMVNVNNKKTNVILGDKTFLLWGTPSIKDVLCDITFKIAPEAFYQVNSPQAERLYEDVIRLAGLSGNETVYDLYCGIGTISLALSKKAKEVYGIEIVPEAIKNAKENAKLNNINNAFFFEGAAEIVTEKLYKDGKKADVVVVDPPRKGCDSALIDTIVKMAPKKLVYVSCNVSTLVRDTNILREKGYKISYIRPYDLFPRTAHCEVVCALQRQASQ